MPVEQRLRLGLKVYLKFFLGLRVGGNIFPMENGFCCALGEDRIAAERLDLRHLAICQYRDVQTDQPSNVSVFETLGIIGLDALDDPSPRSAHRLALDDEGRMGSNGKQGDQDETSRRALVRPSLPFAAKGACHRLNFLGLVFLSEITRG